MKSKFWWNGAPWCLETGSPNSKRTCNTCNVKIHETCAGAESDLPARHLMQHDTAHEMDSADSWTQWHAWPQAAFSGTFSVWINVGETEAAGCEKMSPGWVFIKHHHSGEVACSLHQTKSAWKKIEGKDWLKHTKTYYLNHTWITHEKIWKLSNCSLCTMHLISHDLDCKPRQWNLNKPNTPMTSLWVRISHYSCHFLTAMREFSRIINPPAACTCNHVSNDMWMLIVMLIKKRQNNGASASWAQVFAFCHLFLAVLQLMDNLMQGQLILPGPTCTQNPTALCTPCNVLSFRALTPPGLGVTCISCNQLTCQLHQCHQCHHDE